MLPGPSVFMVALWDGDLGGDGSVVLGHESCRNSFRKTNETRNEPNKKPKCVSE